MIELRWFVSYKNNHEPMLQYRTLSRPMPFDGFGIQQTWSDWQPIPYVVEPMPEKQPHQPYMDDNHPNSLQGKKNGSTL